MLVWQRPNLLLLDEPTNHLDLTTREALSIALNEFEGTVMLVSHDRALLRAVCDEFWLVARGAVEPFDGDLDDYQRYLLDEAKRVRESVREATRETRASEPAAAQSQQARKNATRAKTLRREQGKLEAQILEVQAAKHALEGRLSEPLAPQEIGAIGREIEAVAGKLDALEEQWLTLGEEIEALEGGV